MKLIPIYSMILLGLVACSEGNEETRQATVVEGFMLDAAAVARGNALFEGSCTDFCHQRETSNSDASFLFDCDWKHGATDQEIFDIVTLGVPDTRMLGFGSNFPQGEDDLWKIIAFLRSNQQPCA